MTIEEAVNEVGVVEWSDGHKTYELSVMDSRAVVLKNESFKGIWIQKAQTLWHMYPLV